MRETISVIMNGKEMLIDKDCTPDDIVRDHELDHSTIVVEVNGDIVRRSEYGTTVLKAGDVIEIIHFVGGG